MERKKWILAKRISSLCAIFSTLLERKGKVSKEEAGIIQSRTEIVGL